MNEREMQAMMTSAVRVACNHLTNDELAALNMVAQLDMNPHNRLFDYNQVAHLFTERNGTRMHEETKNALGRVVKVRLKGATNE
jgi:hypothetical protein